MRYLRYESEMCIDNFSVKTNELPISVSKSCGDLLISINIDPLVVNKKKTIDE